MAKFHDLIQALLARLSLRALAEEAGASFRGVGSTPASACPLHHGDNPSAFHLYAGGQRWHCFTRCPDGKNDGDLVAFYMHWKQLDFPSALRQLAERAGFPAAKGSLSPADLRRLASDAALSAATGSLATADLRRLAERAGLPAATDPLATAEFRRLAGGNAHPADSDPSAHPQPAGSALLIPAPPSALWQMRAQACIDYARGQLLDRNSGAAVRAYLYSERGLTPETQEAFQLGYLPRDLFDDPLCWGFHPLPPPIHPPRDPRQAKPASVQPGQPAIGFTNQVGAANGGGPAKGGGLANAVDSTNGVGAANEIGSTNAAGSTALEDSITNGKPVRLYPKKIFIPRGILIPGFQRNTPWYLKIRRPIPGDLLAEYIPAAAGSDRPAAYPGAPVAAPASPTPSSGGKTSANAKFLSVSGSKPTLFGRQLWLGHPTLLLVEGEFDCMLAWQCASDLCDVATLGSAANRASLPDLAELTRYQRILAVYDSDPAGDRARAYLKEFTRIEHIPSPAHDLSDYFRGGGNLRKWLQQIISQKA